MVIAFFASVDTEGDGVVYPVVHAFSVVFLNLPRWWAFYHVVTNGRFRAYIVRLCALAVCSEKCCNSLVHIILYIIVRLSCAMSGIMIVLCAISFHVFGT